MLYYRRCCGEKRTPSLRIYIRTAIKSNSGTWSRLGLLILELQVYSSANEKSNLMAILHWQML